MGNIRFYYDTSQFQQKINSAIKIIHDKGQFIVRDSSRVFASTAAKYTPPNIGKTTIEKKYYTRPILSLQKLICKKYPKFSATPEDYIQYRKNNQKFKILDTRDGKLSTYGYTSSLAQAKRMAKIKNRGLSRVMWGKDLSDIGIEQPTIIKRLLARSPNMTEKKLNIVEFKAENGIFELVIQNHTTAIKNPGGLNTVQIAERSAKTFIERSIQREIDKIAEEF